MKASRAVNMPARTTHEVVTENRELITAALLDQPRNDAVNTTTIGRRKAARPFERYRNYLEQIE